MKKIKLLYLCLLTVFIGNNAHSQAYYNAFAFNLGAVQDGIGGLFTYNYFLNRHDFVEASLFLTASNFKYKTFDEQIIKIPYNEFTVNVGYSKNILTNDSNSYNVNLCGGGVFGYETLNKGETILENGATILSKPGFIYGAYLGIELDVSVTDATSVLLRGNEFYHSNSTLGQFLPFIGAGFRFYIN